MRVGPRNSVAIDAIQHITRGNPELEDVYASKNDKYDYQDLTSMSSTTDRDKILDAVGEDGTSHAALMEHPIRLTSHTVMSPRLKAAIDQAGTYINASFDTKDDILKYLNDTKIRTHLATLVTHELLNSEGSLRTYRDPTATDESTKKKIFAASSIIRYFNSNN